MKQELENYIGKILGCQCVLEPYAIGPNIPLFYASQYDFFHTKLRGTSCVFAIEKSNIHASPLQLQKQLDFLSLHLNIPVVFCARNLEYHETIRIISRDIPLIIPNKVLSLPFLALSLNFSKKGRQLAGEKFSRYAQLIVLAVLLRKLSSPLTIKDAMKKIGCSYPCAANALEELQQFGLGEKQISQEKRELKFHFSCLGKDLWDASQEYFTNPCKYTIGVEKEKSGINGVKAGANALADRTMLGESDPDILAMPLYDYRKSPIKKVASASAETLLQLWQYKPDIFDEKKIDPLSLYLSLKGDKDERIQMALEEMLGGVQW